MAGASQPTVLHVDDDAELLEVARARLANGRFTLHTAGSAEKGLRAIETGTVDCLVSDSLTTSDGEPFVVAARRRAPDLPVVIFTAGEWEDLSEPVREAGTTGYVRKGDPGAFTRLRSRLERVAECSLEASMDPAAGDAGGGGVPGLLAADDADWEVAERRVFGDGEELVYVVTRLLEDRAGIEEDRLPPLYHTLDIELAEELLCGCGSDVALQFTYLDYEFAVFGDGVVALRERASPGD